MITAKDVLSLTEFELMELLDVGLAEVTSALAHISEIACPPYQTVRCASIRLSLLEQRIQNEYVGGHLPACLKVLDAALCGGIPFGVLTELVGHAGIGKTQVDRNWRQQFSRNISHGRAWHKREYEQDPRRQHSLGRHISFIKSLAELSRIPVVMTNQVRSQSFDDVSQYSFRGPIRDGNIDDPTRFGSHLVAALGINWAHAVTIRLVLEAKSGISLLSDDGTEIKGSQISVIHYQGHSAIILST